jgi:hypothetical protein
MIKTVSWPASAVSVLTACCVLTAPLLAQQANSNRGTPAALSGSWVLTCGLSHPSLGRPDGRGPASGREAGGFPGGGGPQPGTGDRGFGGLPRGGSESDRPDREEMKRTAH